MQPLIKQERNYSMDVARIVASFMVICMHVTAAWKYGEAGTFQWNVSMIYDCLCRSAVPLFFMLSGAFYKDAAISKTVKKIVYYTVIFLIVSSVYSLSDIYWNWMSGEKIVVSQFFEGIVNYKYHLWYIPQYVFTLTIAPLIVKIMDLDKDKSLTKYMLIIWLIFGIGTNTLCIAIKGIEQFDLLNKYLHLIFAFVFFSGNHIGYFILGRYLIKLKLSNDRKNILYLSGILATILLYFLTVLYSHRSEIGDDRWLSTLNIFVVIQAAALFILFNNMTVNKKWISIIKTLKPYTFGIYLIHVFFLDWCYRLNMFTDNRIIKWRMNIIWSIPVRVLLIYIISATNIIIIMFLKNNIKSLCTKLWKKN